MTTIILASGTQRRFAHEQIDAAPRGAVVTIKEATRTLDQNAKMWAMLSDVSRAEPEGRKWSADVWKAAFMHLCEHEIRWEQGLDGCAPFPVGFRSSRLSKHQMADLITCIQEYGDRHGVQWQEIPE